MPTFLGSRTNRHIVINIYTGDTEQSVRPHKPTVVKKVKLVKGEPKTIINPYIPDDVPELPDEDGAVPVDVTGGNNVVPVKKPTDKELSKKKSARKRAAEAYKRATEKFSALCEEAGRFDIDTLLQEIQYSLTGEGGLKSEIDALNKEIRSLRSKIARRTKNNEDFTELQTELDQKDAERKEKQEKRDALKARYRKISKAQQSADDRWVDVKNASVVYINYLEGEIVKAADAGDLEYAEALEKKLEEAKRFLERSFERASPLSLWIDSVAAVAFSASAISSGVNPVCLEISSRLGSRPRAVAR